MQWSEARTRIEALFASSVKGHVALHATRSRDLHDFEGRGWITWDREEIVSFESVPYMVRRYAVYDELQALQMDRDEAYVVAGRIANAEGRFALWQFTAAVEDYPGYGVTRALACADPIIRGLAMLDRRLGKRRLVSLELTKDELPFVARLLELRRLTEVIGRAG